MFTLEGTDLTFTINSSRRDVTAHHRKRGRYGYISRSASRSPSSAYGISGESAAGKEALHSYDHRDDVERVAIGLIQGSRLFRDGPGC
jgi:hypothetical protein